jgi:hypothetical protein
VTTYRLPLPRWDTAWEVVARKGKPVRVRKVWDALNLNGRPHWRARHAANREVMDAVVLLGRQQKLHQITGARYVRVVLVWAPGDRRRADAINRTPILKAAADAVAQGTKERPGLGVVPDDDDQHMSQDVRIERPPCPAGLWLEVTVES